MDLIIRKIIFDDVDEITELYIETYKQEPWNENWNKEIARERIKDAIENNIAENYCVNKDNKIVGVMFGHRNYFIDEKELYIDEFFIGHKIQRKGIGKYFLEYIEKDIKQKNYSSMVLLTKKAFPSELFYKKNNFCTSPNMILMYKGIK
jgi:N-acetylglutamate synthase-like GNAT family acetyltransferase